MANRRLLLASFERKRCVGHHEHASVCNQGPRTVHGCRLYIRDAVSLDHARSSPVTSVRGYDLGDPTVRRQPDGPIARPLSGGLGCPACADNVNVRPPSHDRNPMHCRWCDKEDYHWECPS
eukprot:5841180-Pyramimonas_sp.AAC.1